MSLKKQYNKTNSDCKVTFRLSKELAEEANYVFLAGDFNNWDTQNTPLKKLKSGEFSVTLNLQKGQEYQFKYLVNGKEWLNELDADKNVINEFQTENSVVVV